MGQYKSFNTNYMLWLFSMENVKEVYDLFIECLGKEILEDFINAYDLDKLDEKREVGILALMREYIKRLGSIYGNNKANKDKDNYIKLAPAKSDKNDLENKENKDFDIKKETP